MGGVVEVFRTGLVPDHEVKHQEQSRNNQNRVSQFPAVDSARWIRVDRCGWRESPVVGWERHPDAAFRALPGSAGGGSGEAERGIAVRATDADVRVCHGGHFFGVRAGSGETRTKDESLFPAGRPNATQTHLAIGHGISQA